MTCACDPEATCQCPHERRAGIERRSDPERANAGNRRRGPGRPRLSPDDVAVPFNLRFTPSQFSGVCAITSRTGESVSQVLRRAVDLLLIS